MHARKPPREQGSSWHQIPMCRSHVLPSERTLSVSLFLIREPEPARVLSAVLGEQASGAAACAVCGCSASAQEALLEHTEV